MPFLQSSGAISLGNVQTTMGGANPISMSEYYRGGSYVPSTKNVTVRDPTSGSYYSSAMSWYADSDTMLRIRWNDVQVYGGYTSNGLNLTSLTVGAYTYFRGTVQTQGTGEYGFAYYYYSVYRTNPGIAVINTGVPASGQISLSQFYGAEKP